MRAMAFLIGLAIVALVIILGAAVVVVFGSAWVGAGGALPRSRAQKDAEVFRLVEQARRRNEG